MSHYRRNELVGKFPEIDTIFKYSKRFKEHQSWYCRLELLL